MSDSVDEQISALLDGEVTAEELDLLLARLDKNDADRRRMARYVLIGATLRAESANAYLGLADRIRAVLGTNDTVGAWTRTPRRYGRVRSAWLSIAAAAMVAALAVGVAPLWAPGQGPFQARLVAANPQTPVVSPVRVAANSSTSKSAIGRAMKPKHMVAKASPIPADRLATYVASHGAYATSFSQSSWDTRVVNGEIERVSWQVESPGDAL